MALGASRDCCNSLSLVPQKLARTVTALVAEIRSGRGETYDSLRFRDKTWVKILFGCTSAMTVLASFCGMLGLALRCPCINLISHSECFYPLSLEDS